MKISRFFRTILVLALIPLFFIFHLFSAIVILPLLLLRFLVSILAMGKRTSLRKMLPAPGSLLHSVQETYSENAFTLMTAIELPTPCPDINYIRECLEKNAIQALNPDGSLLYPELRETIKMWMGYWFYAPAKVLDLKHHVKLLQDVPHPKIDWKNPDTVPDLQYFLIRKQRWQVGRPLWEFIIIPNVPKEHLTTCDPSVHFPNNEGSIIMLRIHHSIADGISIFKLMAKTFQINNAFNKLPVPTITRKNNWLNTVHKLLMIVKLPYELTDYTLSIILKKEQRISKVEELKKEREFFGNLSKDFPISSIKQLKDFYGVGFSAVLFAMIAGGVRRMLCKEGKILEGDMDMKFVVPMAGHPSKLRNHFGLGNLWLPVSEADPVKRLKIINKRIQQLSKSSIPLVAFMIMKILGSLPPFLINIGQKCAAPKRSPIMVTNMFGPGETVYFYKDLPVIGLQMGANPPGEHLTCYGFIFETYNGRGRLGAGGYSKYFRTKEDTDSLIQHCLDELDILQENELV